MYEPQSNQRGIETWRLWSQWVRLTSRPQSNQRGIETPLANRSGWGGGRLNRTSVGLKHKVDERQRVQQPASIEPAWD